MSLNLFTFICYCCGFFVGSWIYVANHLFTLTLVEKEDVCFLLRALDPINIPPINDDIFHKLIRNFTHLHAHDVFAWLSAPSETYNEDSQHRHWFIRREPPTFSTQFLTQYGIRDNLDFVFYIEQGRPLFALHLHLRDVGATLSDQSIRRIYDSILARPEDVACVR